MLDFPGNDIRKQTRGSSDGVCGVVGYSNPAIPRDHVTIPAPADAKCCRLSGPDAGRRCESVVSRRLLTCCAENREPSSKFVFFWFAVRYAMEDDKEINNCLVQLLYCVITNTTCCYPISWATMAPREFDRPE